MKRQVDRQARVSSARPTLPVYLPRGLAPFYQCSGDHRELGACLGFHRLLPTKGQAGTLSPLPHLSLCFPGILLLSRAQAAPSTAL